MRMVYIIIYDLRNPGRDYNALYDAIKSLSSNWQHPLESTWFISFNYSSTAQTIFDRLRPCIDDNDNLFVVNMSNPNDRQGWLPKPFWQWITTNLQN